MSISEKFKFTLVETGTLEELLQMTPWERMLNNDKMLNRLIAIEVFMGKIYRGYFFIKSQHVYSR
jgi:hypothetical protein